MREYFDFISKKCIFVILSKDCSRSEMDITTAFEAVIPGSNPGGSTNALRKSQLLEIFSGCEPQRCFEKVFFLTFLKPRGGVANTLQTRSIAPYLLSDS